MATFYQVGGSVRDELLGLKAKDIDYAVEADSFAGMREAILARGGEIFLETPDYFTIRARVPELGACDFVLCRKDGAYKDGRHPESVEVGTIYDDLARRDFTVNAIAKGEDGTILDPHEGTKDLKSWRLRCVGKAEDRFTEDGLRMLRAIRFGITKNLTLDHDIKTCLSNPTFFGPRMVGVSVERIREELHKCFAYSTTATLYWLRTYDLFSHYLFDGKKLWLKPTLEAR
jgi:tRNA nucleotidyltransferase (CCA-adding enzyme)